MEAERRLTSWLRFVGALALALGLSSAPAAAAAAGTSAPVREALAATQLSLSASAPTAALHHGTGVRHAVAKHRLPAIAGGLAATALALTGMAFVAVRRRRTSPTLHHHALSHGARAPPAVSCC